MESAIKIFSGRHSRELAQKITSSYGDSLGNVVFNNFKKGYKSVMKNSTEEIFSIVKKIEMRGRYARVD